MHFVNKDNAIPAIAYLFDDLFETLFELAAILGASYK